MSGTILVTGATRGIGRSVTRLLVDMGHSVCGVHRRASEQSRSLAQELGPYLRLYQVDLTSPRAAAALADSLASHSIILRGVVLGAGIILRGPFREVSVDGEDPIPTQIHANLTAPLMLLRALLRADRLASPCSVVVVTSNLVHRGLKDRAVYSATKGGLEAAVRALARELGPDGIRINAVAPGLIRTDMTADLGESALQAHATEVPLRRVGTPADVAPMITFLLGEGTDYITGQFIDIDGGWSV
jgi:3-oxoacyl-[acyl-carrier protein] reductase